MTFDEREEIVAKELLDKADIAKLCGVSESTAIRIIGSIKKTGHDRFKIAGRVHLQDYIDYFNLDILRYLARREQNGNGNQN